MRAAYLFALAACSSDGASDPACDDAGDLVELPLLADTYFDGSAMPHGDTDTFLIGGASQALLRFRLGPELRTPELRFVLELGAPATANDCGAACGACAAMAVGTGVKVSLVRSDWDEASATAELRDAGAAWSMPGPSGVDVVPLAATGATANGPVLSISFNALGLSMPASWPVDEISVLVSPVNASSPAVRYASRSIDCDGVPPRLIARCE